MADAYDIDADIVIAGGGLVGLTAALALASERAGGPFTVAVVDALDPDAVENAAYDGRNSSIAFSSWRLFERLGLAARIGGHAQPINDILVTDGRVREGAAPLFLHFDSDEIGEEIGHVPLGQFVENRYIQKALHAEVAACPRITLLAPATVERVDYDAAHAVATLGDGRRVRAKLCLAADGRNSRVREALGMRTIGWDYDQLGIVVTVIHDADHEGVAQEYFLPSGPFAVLPLPDDEEGRHRSSLVWTERTKTGRALLALPDDPFADEVRARFGSYLGPCAPEGPRWSYPLTLKLSVDYVRPRMALLGDAAHGVHPIAGQGYNLGVRDVAALAEVLVDAQRLGLDIGSLDVLERYQRWRRFDNVSLAVITDGLNRLFSNDIGPLRLARDLGLGLVNRIGPARRFFMRHAAGAVGELPKLLRGEAL